MFRKCSPPWHACPMAECVPAENMNKYGLNFQDVDAHKVTFTVIEVDDG